MEMMYELMDFFKEFTIDELPPNLLSKKIGKLIKPLAEKMHIAKISLSGTIEAGYCQKKTEIPPETIYEKIFTSGNQIVTEEYKYNNKDHFILKAWSVKKSEWTEEETAQVRFLLQLINMMFSKSQLIRQIKKAENTDSLTGVYNSAGIMELGNMIVQKKLLPKFSVAFMNIQQFKLINQRLGSKNGDILMKNYAEYISANIGKDGAFARLGADKFLLLLKTSRIPDFVKLLGNLLLPLKSDTINTHVEIKVKAGICYGNIMPQNAPFDAIVNNAAAAFNVAHDSKVEDFVFYSPETGKKPASKPVLPK